MASAEIAVGIPGIDGFMDICLLSSWSRASKQIMFTLSHRAQPAPVSNGLCRADETDPGLLGSLPFQTVVFVGVEFSGAPHCTVGLFLLPLGCMVHLGAFWEGASWA